jgi:hypothetical protein
MKKFNTKKLNYIGVKEQCMVKIWKTFKDLQNVRRESMKNN